MPWADYECPGCPGIVQNHRFPASLGAKEGAPWCKVCEIQMIPIAAIHLSLGTDGDRPSADRFQKFTIHRQVPGKDGPVQVEETIDSLHKLRQVERDSEQRYRDGEGEPLRFRAFAQNRSNLDQGLFGTAGKIGDREYSSGQAPTKPKPVTRHGQRKPKVRLAKGGGVSPLKG